MITVSRTIGVETEYLYCEDGKPLFFSSINGALQYLADRNFTLADLLALDFNIEEALGE